MAITNVALIGGTGTLGAPVLKALKASEFDIFVLNRRTSKSVYPKTKVITVPDDLNVDEVAKALREKNIDALIITIAGSHVDSQKKLIDAAFKAGVKRMMPAEFGSCDSADEQTNEILPLMKGKKVVRDYLLTLQDKEREDGMGKLTWTSLITGHFFDWGMTCGLLKFDLKARKAYILDGGNIKFSATNLDFIGKAVVKILEKADETANKLLYVHGLHVTQLEVLAALEKATGEKFERIDQNSKEELDVARPKMLEGDGEAREEVVAVWGIVAADWKEKEGFANSLLGLQEEDLDEVIRRVVSEM
ncbi:isoflavone reductase family protein [Pyrenophora tritici-repentis]|uniref:NmrA multi-domain protein n=1 Tax=Pyrenophora tritici-repentis TaxID=45151 RepID=A0A2W1FZ91_9PLEO|nr:NmrA multi-domain protein [Pyrenophora tritici-repentis]KAF7448193.1 NmrA multi-domain protein [Pyrenophora tritici-repentis]KAF7571904.1 NmrA multi-domain protein [Pyrenophora tritici-repentis]KAG9384905.1 NmrA multi-domain protein [Pyrenophora tritici-repentis]KAI0584527.1 NmrA multi-domain protein [Pyrenophora tritici-repentis]